MKTAWGGASRRTGTKGGKSGKKDAKRQLKFHEFWQIPTLLAAAGQSESVCLDVLKVIADRSTDDAVEGEGSSVEGGSTLSAGASALASSFEELSELAKAVADVLSKRGGRGGGGGGEGGGATPIARRTRSSSKSKGESKAAAVSSVVSGGDDGEDGDAEDGEDDGEDDGEWDREAEEDTKVLLNLLYAPRRSRLHSLAKTLCRLENLSHILAWTSCPADGPLPGGRAGSDNGNDTGYHARREAHMLSKGGTRARQYDGLLHDTSRGCPPLDLVEMPRLKLTFTAKPDQDGTLRLFSMDHANLFVSNDRDPRVTKLIAGIPHSLIMSTAQGEMSILVSVWKVARPQVGSQVRRVLW